jgi:hypothetical protein
MEGLSVPPTPDKREETFQERLARIKEKNKFVINSPDGLEWMNRGEAVEEILMEWVEALQKEIRDLVEAR